jgi:hypothetical protein
MHRWTILMLSGLFLFTVSSKLPAEEGKKMEKAEKKAEKKADKATVEGTLVDMACYLKMGASGEKHAGCAVKCAKSGQPMGVLKKGTDEVYTLLVPSPSVADYGEQTVRVTGTLYGHALAPDKFEVQKDGKWEEVKLSGSM